MFKNSLKNDADIFYSWNNRLDVSASFLVDVVWLNGELFSVLKQFVENLSVNVCLMELQCIEHGELLSRFQAQMTRSFLAAVENCNESVEITNATNEIKVNCNKLNKGKFKIVDIYCRTALVDSGSNGGVMTEMVVMIMMMMLITIKWWCHDDNDD